MLKKHSIFVFSLLLILTARAQQPVFRNFQAKDGLPSSEVYDVMQDSKGYMWFSTDAGVSRYDGYTFRNFSTQNGLPDNTIFGMHEDRKGRIWFRSFSGKLSYFLNDSIYEIGANQQILTAATPGSNKNVRPFIASLYVDAADTLWLGIGKGKGYYKAASPYSSKDFSLIPLEKEGIYVFRIDSEGILFGSCIRTIPLHSPINVYDKYQKHVTSFPAKYHGPSNPAWIYSSDGHFLLAIGSSIYDIDSSSCKTDTGSDANLILYEDKSRNTWIGTFEKGVKFYPRGSLRSGPCRVFLHGQSVSGIEQDIEGGYWFSTLDNGVYYMPSPHVGYFNKSNGMSDDKVLAIALDHKGNIFLGLINGVLEKINASGEVSHPIEPVQGNAIYAFSPVYSGKLLAGSLPSFWIDIEKKEKRLIRALQTSEHYTIKYFNRGRDDKTIWASNHVSLVKIDPLVPEITEAIFQQSRIFAICSYADEDVWIGCMDGLWRYKDKKFLYYGNKDPLLRNRIDDMAATADSTLWLATKGAGVVAYKDGQTFQLTTRDGLADDICKTIFIDSSGTVWAGTFHGISRINMKKWKDCSIYNYTTDDGLVTNEINQLARTGDILWAATNQGMIQMDLKNLFKNTTPPPVYINAIKVNMKKKDHSHFLQLRHFENNIHIEFTGLSYKRAGAMNYRYKLEGLDTTWYTTQNTSVQYMPLPSGEYKFLVRAVNNNGIMSASPASFSFIITPPFWATWWFRVIAGVMAIGAGWGFFYIRFKRLKSKNEIEKQILELESKALRAQMNPHFIFNSLNSIQSYISADDTQKAEHYLASFARLIRMTLDNSRSSMIPLLSEMKVLEYYLELEKMRFKDKFTFTIKCSDDIDPSLAIIPSMLLQPYVENAVLHGMMHKEKDGEINVLFRKESNNVICTVDDNGVGREAAAELRQKTAFHRSAGTQITEERINLLNRKGKTPVKVAITDKKDPAGTRIEIIFPYLEEF